MRKFRPVIKGLSWRAFAAFDTMFVAASVMFFKTGHIGIEVLGIAGGIVGMELLTKTTLFVIHERLWEGKSTQKVIDVM